MNIQLPKNVEYILSRLEAAGCRADIVGGPVRDFLLGKTPVDYDVTTDSSPENTISIFKDDRVVETGIKHGTVSIILDGEPYEVTTYRIDGEYKDSRHPESVTFTKSIEEDLLRRDFTMNAIAYNPNRGITDPYGGTADVNARIIRAVGEPKRRFTEDALRILRGVRFAANLGFTVEEKTKAAMIETRALLLNVSAERIYTELKKTVSGAYSHRVINEFSEVLLTVLPELSALALPSEELYSTADYASRLMALFYLNSSEPAKDFKNATLRLHTDGAIRDLGAVVLPLVDSSDTKNSRGATYLLRDIGRDYTEALIALKILLGKSSEEEMKGLYALLDGGVAYRPTDLKINGRTLLNMGAEGRRVGEILNRLLCLVIDGEVENREEELCSVASALLKRDTALTK